MVSGLRLNLGCGIDVRPNYVNVDIYGNPDVLHDLNQVPWPWAENTVSEVVMYNVLEHLPDTVLVMKELYRVCADKALIKIRVPHPRHEDYLSDPTHVRPITIRLMWLFSKKQCNYWKEQKSANTPLAMIHNVDFEIVEEFYNIEQSWMDKLNRKEITEEQLRNATVLYNNVIREIDMTLKVIK